MKKKPFRVLDTRKLEPPIKRGRGRVKPTTPTDKQLAVYGVILDYWAEHATSPTVRTIQRACGVSSANTAFCHIRELVRFGLLLDAPDLTPTSLASRIREAATELKREAIQ